MTTNAKPKANCIAYLRDGYRAEYCPAILEITKQTKSKRIGTLQPRRSARAFTAAFQLGLPERVARAHLTLAMAHLRKQRPAKVHGVTLNTDGSIELNEAGQVRLDMAAENNLTSLTDLDAESDVPWAVVVMFGSARHWSEAREDLQRIAGAIREGGLVRGYVAFPWGTQQVREKKGSGLFVALKAKSDEWSDEYDDDLILIPDGPHDFDEDTRDSVAVVKAWNKVK